MYWIYQDIIDGNITLDGEIQIVTYNPITVKKAKGLKQDMIQISKSFGIEYTPETKFVRIRIKINNEDIVACSRDIFAEAVCINRYCIISMATTDILPIDALKNINEGDVVDFSLPARYINFTRDDFDYHPFDIKLRLKAHQYSNEYGNFNETVKALDNI